MPGIAACFDDQDEFIICKFSRSAVSSRAPLWGRTLARPLAASSRAFRGDGGDLDRAERADSEEADPYTAVADRLFLRRWVSAVRVLRPTSDRPAGPGSAKLRHAPPRTRHGIDPAAAPRRSIPQAVLQVRGRQSSCLITVADLPPTCGAEPAKPALSAVRADPLPPRRARGRQGHRRGPPISISAMPPPAATAATTIGTGSWTAPSERRALRQEPYS